MQVIIAGFHLRLFNAGLFIAIWTDGSFIQTNREQTELIELMLPFKEI